MPDEYKPPVSLVVLYVILHANCKLNIDFNFLRQNETQKGELMYIEVIRYLRRHISLHFQGLLDN